VQIITFHYNYCKDLIHSGPLQAVNVRVQTPKPLHMVCIFCSSKIKFKLRQCLPVHILDLNSFAYIYIFLFQCILLLHVPQILFPPTKAATVDDHDDYQPCRTDVNQMCRRNILLLSHLSPKFYQHLLPKSLFFLLLSADTVVDRYSTQNRTQRLN